MQFNKQQSNELLKPSDDMWFNVDPRKINSKGKSSSKSAMESCVLPQSNPYPRDKDKLKSKSGVDPSHKAKPETLGEILQRESVNGSPKHDELIKYMSNLPGYLKRSDRGKNIQEKALNVGVLDWSQLEKWKNKQTHKPEIASNFTSFNRSEESSSRTAATTSSTTSRGHKKFDDRKGLRSSNIKGSYTEGLHKSYKLPSQNFKRYQYSETEAKEKRSDHDKITSMVENFGSKARHHGVSLVVNENSNGRDIEAMKSMEGLQERNLKSNSDKRLPSLESNNKGVSFVLQKKMSSSSNSEVKKKMDQRKESDTDVGFKQCHKIPSNIVLLRPRKFLQSTSEDYFQPSQSRTSSDEIFSESSHSSSSYISLPGEAYTEEAYSETPNSSALPSMIDLACSSETTEQSVNTELDVDRSSVVSNEPGRSVKMSSLQSEDPCIEKDAFDLKLRNQCAFSNMKKSQDLETAELTANRSLNPSSQRSLSFGLNRIGRSFSFKENSILPKLSSMYVSGNSGLVTSESSACLDNNSKSKVKGHRRTMSTPLMRLLEPILKHKTSNIHHSADCSPTSKGSMSSISSTTMNLHAEKSKESPIQALLQLTIKNGLPLFKFMLNSERKVLAAAMKSLTSPEKDDVGCYYTFYLVNEIKKKSGKWMSHWSKEKNCGYVYNIVAQMKMSSSKIIESNDHNSKKQSMVKDYVLFGVEIDQTNQGPPEFIKSKELAAVVTEIPFENISKEGLHSNNSLKKGCSKCLADERCFCNSQENDFSGRITVILPGGVHSSPNKGEPSPLIHRWKLGGLCDCGGWDVGCKLLVLSNQIPRTNIPRTLKSYLEKFQLFVQEGAEQNTALFTMAPLNDGLYKVEFSSTINHLQAFFISVAVLSCQKPPSSLEISNKQEDISFMSNNELQEKAPKIYNPIPPLSPVDRV